MWSDGEQSTYHAVWLRHNCQCPECWDDTANQKLLIDVKELRSDLRIHSVTGSGELTLCCLVNHAQLGKYCYMCMGSEKLRHITIVQVGLDSLPTWRGLYHKIVH